MTFNLSEWLNLLLRWAHVFAAILWVGSTYYFTWLDGQMTKLDARTGGRGGGVWMVHSGGLFTVVNQKTLGVAPGGLHWFPYHALATFITRFLLLHVVSYPRGRVRCPYH